LYSSFTCAHCVSCLQLDVVQLDNLTLTTPPPCRK
jgi:hypothetical protein